MTKFATLVRHRELDVGSPQGQYVAVEDLRPAAINKVASVPHPSHRADCGERFTSSSSEKQRVQRIYPYCNRDSLPANFSSNMQAKNTQGTSSHCPSFVVLRALVGSAPPLHQLTAGSSFRSSSTSCTAHSIASVSPICAHIRAYRNQLSLTRQSSRSDGSRSCRSSPSSFACQHSGGYVASLGDVLSES